MFYSRAAVNWGVLLALFAPVCFAADLTASIVDAAGKGVAGVVVIAESKGDASPSRSGVTPAIMDQMNKEFVPEILVIRTGTQVLFPNSDSVAHQVYSFSPAKRFALPLYKGKPYPPQDFNQAGVVTLGCNIHDHMVGYIVVTDSPYFAQSNAEGSVRIKGLPSGSYQVSVWHPRFSENVDAQLVNVQGSDSALSFRLTKALRPARTSSSDRRLRDY